MPLLLVTQNSLLLYNCWKCHDICDQLCQLSWNASKQNWGDIFLLEGTKYNLWLFPAGRVGRTECHFSWSLRVILGQERGAQKRATKKRPEIGVFVLAFVLVVCNRFVYFVNTGLSGVWSFLQGNSEPPNFRVMIVFLCHNFWEVFCSAHWNAPVRNRLSCTYDLFVLLRFEIIAHTNYILTGFHIFKHHPVLRIWFWRVVTWLCDTLLVSCKVFSTSL